MNIFAPADRWWRRTVPNQRMDRHPVYLCALLGVLLPSSSIFWFGPIPSSTVAALSELTQVMLCGCIALGCTIALAAAAIPSRRAKYAYRLGYSAAPAIIAGLSVYGWVVLAGAVDRVGVSASVASAMSGMLTPMLAAGFLVQAVGFWLESRRIDRAERIIIRTTVNGGAA